MKYKKELSVLLIFLTFAWPVFNILDPSYTPTQVILTVIFAYLGMRLTYFVYSKNKQQLVLLTSQLSLIEIKNTAKVTSPRIGDTAPGGASSKIKDLQRPTPPLKIFSKATIINISGMSSLIFTTMSNKKDDKTN